jgi:hypothetical protein
MAQHLLSVVSMKLHDALSQLAILGATSIVLRGGRRLELEDIDRWLDESYESSHFFLYAKGEWVEVIELATGRLFARAATVWLTKVAERIRGATG